MEVLAVQDLYPDDGVPLRLDVLLHQRGAVWAKIERVETLLDLFPRSEADDAGARPRGSQK